MAERFRYYTNSGRPCPHCLEWDGEEGTADELPEIPNPECYGTCQCELEPIGGGGGDGDGDDEDGCYCYEDCPQERWSPNCDCPDGCCCEDNFGTWWSFSCNCNDGGGGDGDGGGGGGDECEWILRQNQWICLPPCIECEDIDNESIDCVDPLDCYNDSDDGV